MSNENDKQELASKAADKNRVELAADKYVEDNHYRIEALLRSAFLAGIGEGISMAAKIYEK